MRNKQIKKSALWPSLSGDGKEKTAKRKLSDIDLNEVSLVDLPANKRKFLFFKSSDLAEHENISLGDDDDDLVIEPSDEVYPFFNRLYEAQEEGKVDEFLNNIEEFAATSVLAKAIDLLESRLQMVEKIDSYRKSHIEADEEEQQDGNWPSLARFFN